MFELLLQYSHRLAELWYGSSQTDDEEFEANILIKKVLHIYSSIVALRNTEKYDEIKDLFAEMRLICTRPVSDRVSVLILENPQIIEILGGLRSFCSDFETEIETEWGLKAAGSESSTEDEVCARIKAFPYFNTYANLVSAELSAVRSVEQKPIKKITFIGSGPMPMTSLCLTGRLQDAPTNIKIMNVDRDSDALELSKIVCQRLGSKAEGMEFHLAEASSSLELQDSDVVYLAALVGSSQEEKETLLEEVTSKMRPGALILIRGGSKLRSLMYSVFDPTTERVLKLLEVASVVNPQKQKFVNSIFIGRVK